MAQEMGGFEAGFRGGAQAVCRLGIETVSATKKSLSPSLAQAGADASFYGCTDWGA